jgi:pimeloyl-ACP methyl ester carboxylesterase
MGSGLVTHEKGVLGQGALYEIWSPPRTAWNGALVLYAHGYANPGQPIALSTDVGGMLPILMAQGFAVAQSSYSENGWAVKDGAIRIRQLRGYFAGAYGSPAKAYLVGVSEGALISIMLAEKNPELFSGALCIGGPLGGADMEVNYIYNLRILFDHFFSDELQALASPPTGNPLAGQFLAALGAGALDAHPPAGPGLPADGVAFAQLVVPLMLYLFSIDPVDASSLAATAVDGLPLFNWPVPPAPALDQTALANEMAITLSVGLWYNIFGTEDILDRTHGHAPVDNRATVYSILPSGPVFNVERLSTTKDAANYLQHWYKPTGFLSLPVVILHTSRDPIVPIYHARAYQQLAMAAGSGSRLQEFELPYFGHCQILLPPLYQPDLATFQAALMQAFGALLMMTGP